MDGLFDDLREDMEMLKRHLKVLKVVAKNQPIGIISISRKLNLTPSQTRYSLRILQQKGLIEPSILGATTDFDWKVFEKRLEEKKKELIDEIKKI